MNGGDENWVGKAGRAVPRTVAVSEWDPPGFHACRSGRRAATQGIGDTSSGGPGVPACTESGSRLRCLCSHPIPPSSPPAVRGVLQRGPPVGPGVDRWRPRMAASRRRARIPPSRGWTGNGWGIGIPSRMVGYPNGTSNLATLGSRRRFVSAIRLISECKAAPRGPRTGTQSAPRGEET